RGHVLQPQFHRRALFDQAARPKPINQDSQAVFSRRLFVNSLQLDHCVPLRSWVGESKSRTFRHRFSTVKPYSRITTSPGAEAPKRSTPRVGMGGPTYESQPSVTPASMTSVGVPGGNTWFRYGSGWALNRLQHGKLTTRAFTPSPVKRSRAFKARC